jgi:hypothetical protein
MIHLAQQPGFKFIQFKFTHQSIIQNNSGVENIKTQIPVVRIVLTQAVIVFISELLKQKFIMIEEIP